MRRDSFLNTPAAWIRSGSHITDTAREACAIERMHSGPPWRFVDLGLVVIVVAAAALFFAGWI